MFITCIIIICACTLFVRVFCAVHNKVRGASRIYKRGRLTQGTNLLGRGVRRMLELGGSGGMPPLGNFEK